MPAPGCLELFSSDSTAGKWKIRNEGLTLLPNYPLGDSGFGAGTADFSTPAHRPKLVVDT